MKKLLLLLLVALLATVIPLAINSGNGYVLLVQPPYRIELSTSMFLLLVVLAFLAVYALLRLFFFTLNLPENIRRSKQAQREKFAATALLESLTALAEGRFSVAEKTAGKALELGANPLIACLTAARAAHQLKDVETHDYYLAECERLAPHSEAALKAFKAQLVKND